MHTRYPYESSNKGITDPGTIREMMAQYQHWYHRIELAPGIITPGVDDSEKRMSILDEIGCPKDCTGLRILDIGCSDGFMSFEMEKRNAAEVIAVDYRPPAANGFGIAKQILGSQVEYRINNVYDLIPDEYGTFDIILCLGLLYHLRHPLLALDRIRELCNPGALLFVETHLIDNALVRPDGSVTQLKRIAPELEHYALWQFYSADQLSKGDYTNRWAPNMLGLKQIVENAEFQITGEYIYFSRGCVAARAYENNELRYYRNIG